MSEFKVFGLVSHASNRKGIPNLRVEVWDKDAKNDDLCGSCETNKNGFYTVEFDASVFKDSYKDILPDVYLKIFGGDELLETTKVKKNTPAGETEINVELESSAAVNQQASTKPQKQQSAEAKEKSTTLATGLEDYGRWKAMFKNHKREDDPHFRRGRIWA